MLIINLGKQGPIPFFIPRAQVNCSQASWNLLSTWKEVGKKLILRCKEPLAKIFFYSYTELRTRFSKLDQEFHN